MPSLWINDRDIADFGCTVTSLSGWSDFPAQGPNVVEVVGRAGAWTLPPNKMGARELTVGVWLKPASVATRKAALDTLYAALLGAVDVRINDDPNRYVTAICASVSAQAIGPALVEPRVICEIRFVATDPYFYDVAPTVVGLPSDGSWATIPLGSAPQGGVFQLTGAGTNPTTLTVADRALNTLQTITLSTTWTTAEYVEIDCDQWTIKKWSAGSGTSILSTMASTETFPILNPQSGAMVKVSGGNGGVYSGRKAYLT